MKKQPDPRQSLERTASHILRELPKRDPEHRRSKICRLGRNFSEDATAVQRSFLELEAPKVLSRIPVFPRAHEHQCIQTVAAFGGGSSGLDV